MTFGHHREIRDDDKALAPSEHMYTPRSLETFTASGRLTDTQHRSRHHLSNDKIARQLWSGQLRYLKVSYWPTSDPRNHLQLKLACASHPVQRGLETRIESHLASLHERQPPEEYAAAR
jgi:hypothetical protein